VAFAFLIVMAFATLPSPLYGLYRERDHLSAVMVTVIYAVFACGTIVSLIWLRSSAGRAGRRSVMLAAVATMIAAATVLAAWKDLPGLLAGRLLTGLSVGLAAGTATVYMTELRVRQDPNASLPRARNIGTAVNVVSSGVMSQLATATVRPSRVLALGMTSMVVGLALVVTAVRLSTPSLALYLVGGSLIGAGAGTVFKGTTGLVLEKTAPQDRLAMTSALLITAFVGLSIPVVGAGVALAQGATPPDTVLGFAIAVGLGIAVSGWALIGRRVEEPAADGPGRDLAPATR